MKHIIAFLILTCIANFTMGQELKNLYPTVTPLDFSEKAKADWTKRDKLLEEGKDWEELSEDEQRILNAYSETHSDIWDIVGGGCSWYCGGGPYKVEGSSYLEAQGGNNYSPENAHDLNYKNAWVEGADGYGEGEYLTYYFKAATPRITNIIVVNGYVKSATAWKNNSRVKKLKMYINDKPYAIMNLEDNVSAQNFKVSPIGFSERSDLEIYNSKPDWVLKFEILEVYKGDKYADTVISEIYFDGMDVH